MKETFLDFFKNYNAERYQETRNLLLDESNYLAKVDFTNVHLFLSYIEAASKKSFNRLNAISAYISDNALNLNEQAYPLGLLREAVKNKIRKMDKEIIIISEALQTNSSDPEYKGIYHEEFYTELILQNKVG